MVCAAGASWGFTTGPHTTSHTLVGAAQPGHHHGPGGHGSQTVDDSARLKTRRRTGPSVRRLPKPFLAVWAAVVALARRTRPALPPLHGWALRGAAASSPIALCVCR